MAQRWNRKTSTSFRVHLKAWGGECTGPGIRFICESDAIDDPDHKGFWTTLALWNRWRHDTFKDDRETELQFLDELPTNGGKGVVAVAAPAEVWSPRASRHTS